MKEKQAGTSSNIITIIIISKLLSYQDIEIVNNLLSLLIHVVYLQFYRWHFVQFSALAKQRKRKTLLGNVYIAVMFLNAFKYKREENGIKFF